MSHEIDVSTGKPAIAYIGETPWHGLGEKLPAGAPIESWVRAARLDWELKRLPVQYLVDGKLRTMKDRFVLMRNDTDEALSIVSADYQIVQPKEVLEFYRELVAVYGFTLETSGALDGGRKVWALAKTPMTDAVHKGGNDAIAAYLLLATSCDKTLATTAAFTSIRVVCQNTLFFRDGG
jgi:phage/plasmid-like protein (TIGR03299 family)